MVDAEIIWTTIDAMCTFADFARNLVHLFINNGSRSRDAPFVVHSVRKVLDEILTTYNRIFAAHPQFEPYASHAGRILACVQNCYETVVSITRGN